MTDEELAAIKARWNWILTDALPDVSQAKMDVRALWDEAKVWRRAVRILLRYHPEWYSEVESALSMAARERDNDTASDQS